MTNCKEHVEVRTHGAPLGAEIHGLDGTHPLAPELVRLRHAWNVGDIVYWDNQATLHARTAFDPRSPRYEAHQPRGQPPVLSAARREAAGSSPQGEPSEPRRVAPEDLPPRNPGRAHPRAFGCGGRR